MRLPRWRLMVSGGDVEAVKGGESGRLVFGVKV
jgi:hypothetical protein